MTSDELASFREQVVKALADSKVDIAHPPVAIVASSRPPGGHPFGREYPWGIAESESRKPEYRHSELLALRRFLLIDGLLELKEASATHYEAFRTRTLRAQERSVVAFVRALLSPARSWRRRCCCRARRFLQSSFSGCGPPPFTIVRRALRAPRTFLEASSRRSRRRPPRRRQRNRAARGGAAQGPQGRVIAGGGHGRWVTNGWGGDTQAKHAPG